jgi:hypothetical protein
MAVGQQVNLTVRYGIVEGDRTGSKFTIVLNGSPLKMLRPAPEIINDVLDVGNNYLLVFEKPGYVKKTISVNTGNISVSAKGSLNLTLSARIFKEGKQGSEPTFIKYVYDEKANGFVQERERDPVTYNQTAESRKSAEELLNLITKQEEKEKQYKGHAVKEDALEGRKSDFSQQDDINDEESRELEERKAETVRRAEEARAARVAQIEEQRKAAMGDTERKEQERLTKQQEEQRRQIAALKEKEEERKMLDRELQEKARTEAEARRAEEDRRMAEAAVRQADEERRQQEAAAKAELEQRKREARERFEREQRGQPAVPKTVKEERPMSVEEAGSILSRTEEIIQEDKRVIRQITIRRERQTFVYRQVKHEWGGVFYFRNDQDMTKTDFDLETRLEK